MRILVNGKEAVLKEDSSFEYVSENPLFTEAEDYSLEIEFPLKDCPQNILIFGALHVKGVNISTVTFPCEIITESFDKSGILTITGVSKSEVKGQFLEGMSQQNFASALPSIYITDIDFSDYDGSDGTQASISRVTGDGWANMVVWDSEKGKPIYHKEGYAGVGGWTTRHIYLYHLIALVAQKCGFSVDDTVLRSISMYTKICVVNVVYTVYDRSGYDSFPSLARALPHWTVKQFFEEVGNFFGCVCEVSGSKITFKSYKQLSPSTAGAGKVNLTVNDDFEVELQSGEDQYKGNIGFKLPDDADPDKVNTCTWLAGKSYLYYTSSKTLTEMETTMQAAAWGHWQYVSELQWAKKLLYDISDKNIDLVLTSYKGWNSTGYDEETQGHPEYIFCEFEPLGQYGSNDGSVELGIAPCPLKIKKIWYKPSIDGDMGDTMRSSTYGYRMPVVSVPQDKLIEYRLNDNEPLKEILDVISDGEDNEVQYYQQLWVVLHSGTMDQRGHYLNTRKFEPTEDNDYISDFKSKYYAQEGDRDYPNYNYSLSEHTDTLAPCNPSIQALASLPQVDETKLYRYKFLSKTLPDPKAIYVIKGKEYACLRLTAHFTVDGMSELIEGEFYEIVG